METPDSNIIFALDLVESKMKITTKTSKLLKAEDVNYDPAKKIVIGGDSTDFNHDNHPAIIIEKDGDIMSKIIVRCPCGRHSELLCEYDQEIASPEAPTEAVQNEADKESPTE